MKKRMYAVTLAASVVLTGCASVPDLSDKASILQAQCLMALIIINMHLIMISHC